MKSTIFLSAVFLTSLAAATPVLTPRIVKVSHTGFVTPGAERTEECEVYSNKVIITHYLGQSLTEKHSLRVRISNLQSVILAAVSEPTENTPNPICDTPETTTMAEIQGSTLASILLFQTGGCGQDRSIRQGSASQQLRDLIDQFCPLTYDSNGE